MSFSAHEMLLLLRARDEASRTLNRFSNNLSQVQKQVKAQNANASKAAIAQAMAEAEAGYYKTQRAMALGLAYTSVGTAALGMGIMSAKGFEQAADAAIEYRKQATSTFTQVDDGGKTTLENVVTMGRNIADNFAVPFEEVQGTLYDIFSSIEATGKEVETIMEATAKAAIGGSTDLKSAQESIIGVMNAYGYKAKDVNKINDIMFQLVRKGVGNFSQFTAAIGKATPSARRAGQGVKSVAAMLALMTRNGIKVGTAGTYAARAMDAMSNPKTAENMKKFGISIYNAKGQMRPMIDIVNEMKDSMEGLSTKQKTAMLSEMFKGSGGTIQALKFFNTALNDTDNMYKTLTDDMNNASKVIDENGKIVGAAQVAYEAMANTDAAKLQKASNDIALSIQKIGDAIIPIKVAIAEFFGGMADAFNKLDPQIITIITQFGVAATVIGVLAGVILTITGIILMFQAAAVTATVAISSIVWPILAVIAAVAALVAIGYVIMQNWDAIAAVGARMWQDMQTAIDPLIKQLEPMWKQLSDGAQRFIEFAKPGFEALMKAFEGLANAGGVLINFVIVPLGAAFVLAGNMIANVLGWIMAGLGLFLSGVMTVFSGVINFITSIFTGQWGAAFGAIGEIVLGLVRMIMGVFVTFGGLIGGVISGIVNGIIGFFTYLYDVLVGHSIVPDMINAVIKWFVKLPGQIFGIISGFISGVVNWFMSMATKVLSVVANIITKVIRFWRSLPGKVISAISSLAGTLASTGKAWFDRLSSAVTTGIGKVVGFVKDIPRKIKSALGNVGSILYNAGSSILSGFLRGLKSMWDNVTGWVRGIGTWIANNKGPISYDLKLLQPAGKAIMKGLHMSMRGAFGMIERDVRDLTGLINIGESNTALPYGMVQSAAANSKGGKVSVTVNTQEIDPRKHGAELGFELARALGL